MRSTRARRVVALVGALFLLSQAASANHATAVVSVSPATTNAYGDVTMTLQFDGDEPASMTIEWPTGWLVAQQTGTSPVSPIPNDEEQVGSGTLTARFIHLFCGTGNLGGTITWESSIDPGAPANTVGQLTWTSAGIFNTQIYIVRNGTNDYDFVIPTMPSSVLCSSTSDGLVTFAFDAELPSGNRLLQNPSTAGTYCFGISYTDTATNPHGPASPCVAIT